eukprot:COSAG01_NODE_2492_length_7583_cov_4.761491_4_plen_1034_part_00
MAPTSYVFEDVNVSGGGLNGFSSGGHWLGGGGLYVDNMGESTAAMSLKLRRVHIANTSFAGLQFEGIAADKTAVTLEQVTLTDVATNFGREAHSRRPPPNSLAPIVMGDPKYGDIGLDFLVGTLAFGGGCVVRDSHRRPFLKFVAQNGSAGVAGLTGRVTVINAHHPKACQAELPGQGLMPWGEGDGLLDLSLQINCAAALNRTANLKTDDSDHDRGPCQIANRVECGHYGITQADCEGRGCCFDSTPPASKKVFVHAFASAPPVCFYAGEGVAIKKVIMIQSNHFDAGYTTAHEPAWYNSTQAKTGLLADVLSLYFHEYIPQAVATATELRRRGGEERLRWMTQAYVVSMYLDCPARHGLRCPSQRELGSFRSAVKRGDIWWHALPHNAELATFSAPMIQAALALTHALDAEFGLVRKRVLSQRDVPGIPRSALTPLLDSGVEAISVGANGAVVSPNVPPLFVWREGTAPVSTRAAAQAASEAARQVGLHISPPGGNRSMLVMFHAAGYGKLACLQDPSTCPKVRPGVKAEAAVGSGSAPYEGHPAPDFAQAPGCDTVLLYAWRKDNSGPANASEVIADFATARRWFPGAVVAAGDFSEFVDAISSQTEKQLPVLSADLTDSWLMGMASDPIKTQQVRAMQLAYGAWLRSGGQHADASNFSRQFIKSGEHTWGMANRYLGKTSGLISQRWSNAEFHKGVANADEHLSLLASSWVEQRKWAIDYAREALQGHEVTAALATDIAARFRRQQPEPSFPAGGGQSGGWTQMDVGAVLLEPLRALGGWCTLQLDGRGAISKLLDETGRTRWQWSRGGGANASLGLLRYQTLNDDSYRPFRAEYLLQQSNKSCYGKPGLTADIAPHRVYEGHLAEVWLEQRNCSSSSSSSGGGGGSGDADDTVGLQLRVRFDLEGAHHEFGAPAEVWVRISISCAGSERRDLNWTVQVHNKTSTRVAEAMYFTVPEPVRRPGAVVSSISSDSDTPQWLMDKIGTWTSPTDQVDGAGKGIQYHLRGRHKYGDRNSRLTEIYVSDIELPY